MIRFLIVLLALVSATAAGAQDLSITLPEGGSLTNRSIQMFLLVTVLSLVPAIAIMFTCFPFMVTVLGIMRQGLGLQASPPNMLIISLALFLTYFVMEPVFQQGWQAGIEPLIAEQVDLETGILQALDPFRTFMAGRVDPTTFANLADLRPEVEVTDPIVESPFSILIPSFLLSEISRAFQVGFLIFLPFLIIDLVVAAILMSMGMMMVPPAIVSLPFKLAFFVIADGWSLVSGALVSSYM